MTKRADGLYKTKRTVNIRVSNNGSSKAVANCKVQISSIEPEYGFGPWVLKENFVLAAGDEMYIPLAKYSEANDRTKSDYHDDVIEVCMPEGTPILRVPLLQTAERNRLTIRATGIDTPFAELGCELWIDETGRLRIQDVSKGEGKRITLHEAAMRAHEQLRHRPIAVIAEGLTKSENYLMI